MKKYTNKKATYNNKEYEIFLVTEFAQHIERRKNNTSHLIDLKEV